MSKDIDAWRRQNARQRRKAELSAAIQGKPVETWGAPELEAVEELAVMAVERKSLATS